MKNLGSKLFISKKMGEYLLKLPVTDLFLSNIIKQNDVTEEKLLEAWQEQNDLIERYVYDFLVENQHIESKEDAVENYANELTDYIANEENFDLYKGDNNG